MGGRLKKKLEAAGSLPDCDECREKKTTIWGLVKTTGQHARRDGEEERGEQFCQGSDNEKKVLERSYLLLSLAITQTVTSRETLKLRRKAGIKSLGDTIQRRSKVPTATTDLKPGHEARHARRKEVSISQIYRTGN